MKLFFGTGLRLSFARAGLHFLYKSGTLALSVAGCVPKTYQIYDYLFEKFAVCPCFFGIRFCSPRFSILLLLHPFRASQTYIPEIAFRPGVTHLPQQAQVLADLFAVACGFPVAELVIHHYGPLAVGHHAVGAPRRSAARQDDFVLVAHHLPPESPMPVIAATSPTNCFDAAYMVAKIALEHMTPVVLLTDAFVANGSAAWKLPNLDEYPAINPPYVTPDMAGNWTPYQRNEETGVRYWAIPGTEGFMHRIGGLEKSNETGAISTEPENHNKMVHLRQAKVDKIADYIPELEVLGDKDADLLIVGWGGTYGHLRLAMDYMREHGKKVAFAHFQYINPLPKNTADVLRKYKKIVVAEQNLGQFAGYLRMKVPGLNISQFNQVKGQPFVTRELIDAFTKLLEE